ncbi:MAG: xylulokinase [Acidobacteria bacterium]|nr:xylulokinase [Acidobacteriota bacterium]
MNFLGIDVGTGGSRAVLVDARGRVVASATVEHEPFASPQTGWAEQDARDWWRASAAAVRAVLSSDGVRAEEVGGVGLTGQMHGSVLLDASGEVLRPALIWCDQRTDAQCRAITERVGEIDEGILPSVFESAEVVGRVSREGAEATGLKAGTVVVAGAGDQAAGAVGMGIVRPGSVSATIGTSGVVFAATDRPALDAAGRVHTFCHAVPGRWHVMGVTQGAGLSLRWLRDLFGAGADDGRDPYERLTEEAATAPAGSGGVLWAPYLMGERTPHLDPHARAALVGINASHTRAHVTRAVLEGVAFSLRDTFEIFREMRVPVEAVRLGGGGARSGLWRQIQADVYGREVETVEAEEGAAYGAALLAGAGCGAWATVDEACDSVVRVSRTIKPDARAVELLNERYEAFRRLYPALKFVAEGGEIGAASGRV